MFLFTDTHLQIFCQAHRRPSYAVCGTTLSINSEPISTSQRYPKASGFGILSPQITYFVIRLFICIFFVSKLGHDIFMLIRSFMRCSRADRDNAVDQGDHFLRGARGGKHVRDGLPRNVCVAARRDWFVSRFTSPYEPQKPTRSKREPNIEAHLNEENLF